MSKGLTRLCFSSRALPRITVLSNESIEMPTSTASPDHVVFLPTTHNTMDLGPSTGFCKMLDPFRYHELLERYKFEIHRSGNMIEFAQEVLARLTTELRTLVLDIARMFSASILLIAVRGYTITTG